MVVRVFNPKKKRKIKKKNKQNKSPRNTYTEIDTHIGNSLNTKSETVICNQKTNKVKGAWKKTYETKTPKIPLVLFWVGNLLLGMWSVLQYSLYTQWDSTAEN